MERFRRQLSKALAIAYLVAAVSFWIGGAAAYLRAFDGAAALLGFLYVPILALPAVGRGALGALSIHSPVWVWWYVLQVGLATAWILVSPKVAATRERPGL